MLTHDLHDLSSKIHDFLILVPRRVQCALEGFVPRNEALEQKIKEKGVGCRNRNEGSELLSNVGLLGFDFRVIRRP